MAEPADFGGVSFAAYSVLLRLPYEPPVALALSTLSTSAVVSNVWYHTNYELAVHASNNVDAACFAGVYFAVVPGDTEVLFVADDDATEAALGVQLQGQHGPAALRFGTGQFAPVVNIAVTQQVDLDNGVVPLLSSYFGEEVVGETACLVGAVSDSIGVLTDDADLPGRCDAPALVGATGGSLTVAMDSPPNTGGSPVSSFVLLLRPHDDDALADYLEVRCIVRVWARAVDEADMSCVP